MKDTRDLIHKNFDVFHERDVDNIIGRGGTILWSDRCDEFRYEEGILKAKATCIDNDIDGIVAIGWRRNIQGGNRLYKIRDSVYRPSGYN